MLICAIGGVLVFYNVGAKVYHYHDSEFYIRAALNLASGKGSLQQLYVGLNYLIPFNEHPPFWIFVNAIYFKLFGSGPVQINLFPALVAYFCAIIIATIAYKEEKHHKAFFWAFTCFLLNPVVSKWYHEPLLDWGLVLASTIFLLTVFKVKKTFYRGLLLSMSAAIGFLAKGIFSGVFFVAGFVLLITEKENKNLLGYLFGVSIMLILWFIADSDFAVLNSMINNNIEKELASSGILENILPVVITFIKRNLPWSLFIIFSVKPLWNKSNNTRICLLVILLTLIGFIISGKYSTYYWLMLVPVLSLCVGLLVKYIPNKLELFLRYFILIGLLLFVSLRPFVNLTNPSNRSQELRNFISTAQSSEKINLLGVYNLNKMNYWNLLTYGWNHFGFDTKKVCIDDETQIYDYKWDMYVLPCYREVDRPLEYIMMPVNSWRNQILDAIIIHSDSNWVIIKTNNH